MKKISKTAFSMVFIVSILFASVNVQAQRGGQNEPPPIPSKDQVVKMVDNLSKKLDLTADQESKIRPLYTAHFDKIRELHAGNNRPGRETMQKLISDFEKQVKALLTPEQQKLFDSMQKEKQARQRNGGLRR